MKTWKEWFTIQSLDFTYTERMDQAFRGAHGVGLVDYQHNSKLRLKVEMERERDHELGQQMAAKLERQAHREVWWILVKSMSLFSLAFFVFGWNRFSIRIALLKMNKPNLYVRDERANNSEFNCFKRF